jgi:hypothetical protein
LSGEAQQGNGHPRSIRQEWHSKRELDPFGDVELAEWLQKIGASTLLAERIVLSDKFAESGVFSREMNGGEGGIPGVVPGRRRAEIHERHIEPLSPAQRIVRVIFVLLLSHCHPNGDRGI